MDTESEKIITEQVKKLPKEVRDALASEDLHKDVIAIGQKHHLHLDQVGLLEDEVVLVMMGLATPADLPSELTKQLSLQLADAEAIANDISEQIFLPIREAMKKFTEQPPSNEKSVVMPSSVSISPTSPPLPPKATPMAVSAPIDKPTSSTPTITPTPALKMPEMHAADLMLSEPTISMPPPAGQAKPVDPATPIPTIPLTITAPASNPPTPKVEAPKAIPPYKADPYREPPE